MSQQSRIERQDRFLELRKEYPIFRYDGYDLSVDSGRLHVLYSYSLLSEEESVKLQFSSPFALDLPEDSSEDLLEKLHTCFFHLGLVDAMSYWKTTCSPRFDIACGALTAEQEAWWKKLFYYGLGEFRYQNGIDVTADAFVNFSSSSGELSTILPARELPDVMIPIGGGKDSLVTMEIMKEADRDLSYFLLNEGKALPEILEKASIADDSVIRAERKIDPRLLELNRQGFLNGHTPFSALLAFLVVLVGEIHNKGSILLSNESSANEGNVQGEDNINHQYSKTFEFESDVREYLSTYVSPSVDYFSFLRPLNELQIAMIFSKFPRNFGSFRSCNRGSRDGVWCCACPKCLFVAIILAPFLSRQQLDEIFPRNPLDDSELEPILRQLIGVAETKPFECVGTYDEVRAALDAAVDQEDKKDLALLRWYQQQDLTSDRLLSSYLQTQEVNHFVPDQFHSLIRQHIDY